MRKNTDLQKQTQHHNERASHLYRCLSLRDTLRPRRQLGQNFLIDHNIIRKIMGACQLRKEETVLEIGPGLGALTHHLARHVHKVIAIETDKRYYTDLKNRLPQTNIDLIHADFLQFPIQSLPQNLKVIANLPYNICSAIVARLLEHKEYFSSLYFTVQLEFGRRMVAKSDTKDYSAFSILVQYHTRPQILFKIRRTSFHPQPKVDSCFVRLNLLAQPGYPADDQEVFFDVVRRAFGHRRKTLTNALEGRINKDQLSRLLKQLNLNPKTRAEDLTVADFVGIANLIAQR